MKLTEQRIKELIRAESKLQALESGGVDNWEWYDESLKEWRKENEMEELKDAFYIELSEAFGCAAYEPSERGAGVAFREDLTEEFNLIVDKFLKDLKSIEQE